MRPASEARCRFRPLWLLGLLALSAPHAVRAQARDGEVWVPTTALALGSAAQRVAVRLGAAEHAFERSELRPGLALGLVHPVPRLWACCVPLEGHVSLGLGPTLVTGNAQITLREDWFVVWRVQRWLALHLGLGAGLLVDASAGERHQLDFGLPLGVALGDLEIVYRPSLSIPIARRTQAVFGGEVSRSAAFALVPLEVQLRMRWSGLAW